MKRLFTTLLFGVLFSTGLFAQQVVVTADITTNTTWTASNEYVLDGLIFVDSLATLTIEPGTVIKARTSTNITTGDAASALIIRRGAQIDANGTAANPIIFTSELDDVTVATDTDETDRGLWGGLIILGRATTNETSQNIQIEGIPLTDPAAYGGTVDDDNSGTLRYVSIRHGGFSISGISGDEINGLTMGAVGSGTTIEHVEVFANFDDCFEWFGGTVNTKWLVGAFCGDDTFDYDQGFRGNHQFWFAIQAADEAGRAGEHDGGDTNETGMPFSIPTISNVTYIGSGATATGVGGDGNDRTFAIRDNAGGKYYNSVFTDFAGVGVNIEDLASGDDSRNRLVAGDLVFSNNLWWGYGAGNTAEAILPQEFVRTNFVASGNTVEDVNLRGIGRAAAGNALDPRPALGSPANSGASYGFIAEDSPEEDFFAQVPYRGAFGGTNWAAGWTAVDALGYFGDIPLGTATGQVVVSNDITANTTWTADNEYILDGLVFVDAGATLTVQAGTVIKGRFSSNISTGEGASALIVRRGAQIDAQGTASNPIIMTSELDDVADPADLTFADRGLWGGLILLGAATTNETSTDIQIEGIPVEQPAVYGGTDDADNSGTLRYVSLRHGGFSISGVPGDEINGLTMGAVGSGTTIEYFEVFANLDDCFEWFGGTVNTNNLVGAFCGDDTFDYDQGFRGDHQFWFSMQSADEAGRAGEHDGGDTNETGTPFSIPTISNVTYIGSGATATGIGGDGNDRTFAIRDNAGGKYYNSVFTDFAGVGVNVEDLASGDDSRGRLEAGDLVFSNNLWWGYGAGNTAEAILPQEFVRTNFVAAGNSVEDVNLRGISRAEDGGLDPRPALGSPANSGASYGFVTESNEDNFSQVPYRGAFGGTNWTNGWTALDEYGFNGDIPLGTATGQVVVTNDITADVTWTADNEYILDGLVFVDAGATLTVQAGTVIKGRFSSNISTGEGASALIVRRGAQIDAQGTASNPIIMTSELDDVADPADLTFADRGLWGGLILLGAATTNETSTNVQIEGIPVEQPAVYGGTDDADDSGTLRYVSLRHGGFSISGVPGDEINGLTMGAVGSGTTIEFFEVFANLDDCFEWFGGTVSTKWLVGAYCGDDTFDYDQGFRGNHQFWFSMQSADEAGRAGEHDGGDTNETGTPFSIPTISNVTYIGSGATATGVGGDGNDRTFAIRDNAGGKYYNSVFTDFAGVGVNIEDLASGDDSRGRLEAGDLVFSNNLWWGYGAGNTAEAILPQEFVRTNFVAAGNSVEDVNLRGISRAEDGGLDPRPALGSPASAGASYGFIAEDSPEEDFFAQVPYRGAFGGTNWTNGWTALDEYGFNGDIPLGTATGQVVVTNDITANTTWTADNEYILDGLVFVDAGATLTIQPGTVIKGRFSSNISTGEGASALIVRRGASIEAVGTSADPIIFTTELDDVTDPDDLDETDRGLWGGLILLGAATTNETSTNIQIEGIPVEQPAVYGGTDDADDSGTLRYVSLRHGGFSISGVPGDEINGLTMGAVGSGTTIEFFEVYANLDDCFEWFGGTVNTKWLVGAFCGDDTYDYDQGFRGNHQYWFSIQGADEAGRAGEHDGGDTNETGMPFSIPVIANVTYIGSGATATGVGGDGNDRTFAIRDNAGGKYYNSVFTDFAGVGVNIEDLASGDDSRARLEAGDIDFANNAWFGYGAGNTAADILPQDFVLAAFAATNNQVVDPVIQGISRTTDGGLNPLLDVTSPFFTTTATSDLSGNGFHDAVTWYGAFPPNTSWINDWTALAQNGYLEAGLPTNTDDEIDEEVGSEIPTTVLLDQNYPNPFNPTTNISFSLPQAQQASIRVYDLMGRLVATLAQNERFSAGQNVVTFDATNLASGVYIYQLISGNTQLTRKMTLIK